MIVGRRLALSQPFQSHLGPRHLRPILYPLVCVKYVFGATYPCVRILVFAAPIFRWSGLHIRASQPGGCTLLVPVL